MATHKLLLLPGDGIGPEVMGEVQRLIDWLNEQGIAHFETEQGLVGGSAYDAHQVSISESDMAKATSADAVLFGAVGGPKWDNVPYDVRPEAGLLRLRKDLGLFANLRPAVCYPALADASSLKREVVEGLDIMIVRELTGGVYFGEPKTITDLGNGQKRAIDTQVYDTYEIERIARVAFDLARKRRNKLTSMEKRNVMKSGVLWNEVVTQVHALGYRGDADRLARHAAVGLARRDRCQNQKTEIAVRAGARLGARHRRQGIGQSDRHDRIIRNCAALFLRHGRAGRQGRFRDRSGARERPAHRGHQVRGHHGGLHDADGRGDSERVAGAARVAEQTSPRRRPGERRVLSLGRGGRRLLHSLKTVGWAKRSVPTTQRNVPVKF